VPRASREVVARRGTPQSARANPGIPGAMESVR
jgi:hypothetical protein